MTKIAIFGACGRMGRKLIALAHKDQQVTLQGAIASPKDPLLNQDIGNIVGIGQLNIPITSQITPHTQAIIDFSSPAATKTAIAQAQQNNAALVIGTTGLSPQDQQNIDQAAKSIPILQAPNMSLGVNLLFVLAAQVAKQLGDEYDIEIIESHHRFKKDSPSGTALGIAQAICNATGKDIDKDLDHGRQGPDTQRKPGRIGMHAIRQGDIVGDHTASFANLGERIELTHIASNRDVFAYGAIKAAKWLATQKPGRYTMKNVLGL